MIDKKKSDAGKKGAHVTIKLVRERNTKAYYNNPNYCKSCGNIIELVVSDKGNISTSETRKKKFCNSSCAARYNNKFGIKNNKQEKRCQNPECSNYTKNPKFCCPSCSSRMLKLNKIERFLNGELTDKTIRNTTIREYLIEKQGEVCDICKMPPFWNLKPIVFIVDHVDGNYENNSPENMRAICPNCNSQTDTFGSKNKRVNHKSKRPLPNKNRQHKNLAPVV